MCVAKGAMLKPNCGAMLTFFHINSFKRYRDNRRSKKAQKNRTEVKKVALAESCLLTGIRFVTTAAAFYFEGFLLIFLSSLAKNSVPSFP